MAEESRPPPPGRPLDRQSELPRRVPGASAIQTPPGARRLVAPRRVDPSAPATASASAAVPPAAVPPAAVSPAAMPPAADPPTTQAPSVTVKQSQPAGRAMAVWPARRLQLAGLIMAVVALIAAVVALVASRKPAKLQRNVR